MKKLSQVSLFLMLALVSSWSFATGTTCPPGMVCGTSAPEMDASIAVLGLGLVAGMVALVAERRRK